MTNLSPRLQAVLGLLAAGYTYKEVALRLGLKRDTARKYAQRATTRLGARTVIQAVVMFEMSSTPERPNPSVPRVPNSFPNSALTPRDVPDLKLVGTNGNICEST